MDGGGNQGGAGSKQLKECASFHRWSPVLMAVLHVAYIGGVFGVGVMGWMDGI